MAALNRIGDFSEEMAGWRRWLHQHPELAFDLPQTSGFVADKLRSFGVDDIHEGMAQSGVVAVIRGQGDGPTIGLRADMDALPILEDTGAEWASRHAGRMHACGHDGHTAMLLGAAKYLTETRNFAGTAVLIFQPAEEDGGGADVMIRDGLLERFPLDQIFALHTSPKRAAGTFASRPGPFFAIVDDFTVQITGKGGHAAHPEATADPLIAAAALVQALQTIVSRNRTGDDALVLSVTKLHAGDAFNVIPATAHVAGTIRSYDKDVAAMATRRVDEIARGIAAAHGVAAEVEIVRGNGVTFNDPASVDFAGGIARSLVGDAMVDTDCRATLGGEDFGFLLDRVKGAMFWIGQGQGPGLHHPAFDFNDDIAALGASFFVRLVEGAAPLDTA